MKTQVRKYISFVLPVLIILFTIGLVSLSLFMIVNNYDFVIQFLLKYSHFPENKSQDLKNEYLTIERFNLLLYAVLTLSCFFIIVSCLIIKKRNVIYLAIESFCVKIIQILKILWNRFRESPATGKAILSFCFLYVAGLVLWGAYAYPLIYDEVFSYLYFVNKGFLVAASYYPGPNNHIFYLLSCNAVDVISDNPLFIMRVPSLLASLFTCILLLLYFNKRFSAHFAALLVLCLYSSYSVFYYSFHGRGYSFILFFFVLSLLSIYEFVKRRNDFYLILFILVSIAGSYTIPVFIYPLGAFAVFLIFFSVIKKDKNVLKKIFLAYLVISTVTIILYSPIILVSGLNALINNSWVKPLSWHDFILGYGTYVTELQNHFWEVPALGWVISSFVFLGGTSALYKWRKTWWILLSLILLLCPFLFVLLQKVFPFMRTLDYLFVVYVFLLVSFFNYLLSLLKGNIKIVIRSILMSGIVCLGLTKVIVQTPAATKYYKDLEVVMNEILESNVTSIYSKDDTYALFVRYFSVIKNRNLQLISQPGLNAKEIFIIPSNEEIKHQKISKYHLLIENQSVKVYKMDKK